MSLDKIYRIIHDEHVKSWSNLVNPVNDRLDTLAIPKGQFLTKSSPFSSIQLQLPRSLHATVPGPLKQCDFVRHCLKVSHRYVSFSAFPRDRVPPQNRKPSLGHRALGTKFEMQAPGLKEEKR